MGRKDVLQDEVVEDIEALGGMRAWYDNDWLAVVVLVPVRKGQVGIVHEANLCAVHREVLHLDPVQRELEWQHLHNGDA
jgi:hypothetical protein